MTINEAERIIAVRSLGTLGSGPTEELAAIADLARELLKIPRAAVHIVDEDWLRIAVQAGIQVDECSRDKSICTRVVETGKILVIEDLKSDVQLCSLPYVAGTPGFRFYAGVPLELEPGLIVATFCVLDVVPRSFSDDERRLLQKFGKVANGLLRLQRSNSLMSLNERNLREAVQTDPLTLTYNRFALDGMVPERLYEALEQKKLFGALLIDLDRFKSINDTHGHAIGDAILQEAAHRFRCLTEESDIIVRIGGDEFAIFMPDIEDDADLAKRAGSLVDAFRAPIKLSSEKALPLTLSIGGALASQGEEPILDLLARADKALYEAKAGGRNRFVLDDTSELVKN
ncbi:GGDEF domain-containing protein [Oryzifoliimicrobium ureilyticus]|uniref:GGDEF domain-containing protein n=1 Tax=Oryzifoliimicrobium ureilyticus TaxID=3113724 RepID=UPI003076843D